MRWDLDEVGPPSGAYFPHCPNPVDCRWLERWRFCSTPKARPLSAHPQPLSMQVAAAASLPRPPPRPVQPRPVQREWDCCPHIHGPYIHDPAQVWHVIQPRPWVGGSLRTPEQRAWLGDPRRARRVPCFGPAAQRAQIPTGWYPVRLLPGRF